MPISVLDAFREQVLQQTGRKIVRKTTGFTLIELLIGLAIVAILAMVAYPSYQDSMQKTRRADGMAAALAVQVAQERFRGNCPFYAQTIGSANTCGANAGASTVAAPSTSSESYYTLSILANSATGNAYTIVATPQGLQAGDTACAPMTITFNAANPNGLRAPAACW